MIQYFIDFLNVFLGNNTFAEPLAYFLAVATAIGLIYMLLNIVTKNSRYKAFVFIIVLVVAAIIILSSYGIYPITIINATSSLGVA